MASISTPWTKSGYMTLLRERGEGPHHRGQLAADGTRDRYWRDSGIVHILSEFSAKRPATTVTWINWSGVFWGAWLDDSVEVGRLPMALEQGPATTRVQGLSVAGRCSSGVLVSPNRGLTRAGKCPGCSRCPQTVLTAVPEIPSSRPTGPYADAVRLPRLRTRLGVSSVAVPGIRAGRYQRTAGPSLAAVSVAGIDAGCAYADERDRAIT